MAGLVIVDKGGREDGSAAHLDEESRRRGGEGVAGEKNKQEKWIARRRITGTGVASSHRSSQGSESVGGTGCVSRIEQQMPCFCYGRQH